jgi:hypothetical protein
MRPPFRKQPQRYAQFIDGHGQSMANASIGSQMLKVLSNVEIHLPYKI